MLSLMRHKGETIIIGEGDEQIEIKVCKLYGNQVHLGIDAPKHIKVDRGEIRDSKEKDIS